MIVLDTNLLSELMRPAPSADVVGWVKGRSAGELCTTAITVAEVRYGIERLPNGKRRQRVVATVDEVFAAFADKILPFDANAARHYGSIVLRRERAGLPISGFDAQIASICQAHRAALATRNTRDFDGTGVEVVNPWEQRHR